MAEAVEEVVGQPQQGSIMKDLSSGAVGGMAQVLIGMFAILPISGAESGVMNVSTRSQLGLGLA